MISSKAGNRELETHDSQVHIVLEFLLGTQCPDRQNTRLEGNETDVGMSFTCVRTVIFVNESVISQIRAMTLVEPRRGAHSNFEELDILR
jgi:hypothetical protein